MATAQGDGVAQRGAIIGRVQAILRRADGQGRGERCTRRIWCWRWRRRQKVTEKESAFANTKLEIDIKTRRTSQSVAESQNNQQFDCCRPCSCQEPIALCG